MADQNYLEMSDDEILNMLVPGAEPEEKEPEAPPAEPPAEDPPAEIREEQKEPPVENPVPPSSTEVNNGSNIAPEATIPAQVEPGNPDAPAATPEAATPSEPPASEPAAPAVDYEGFYKKIMTPFRANGKTITLQSPEEAIQLMQMGANYTRKMQDIQPHRKVLLMLENNGLLDEGKLSFLIDVDKKNPEAIKKLIKEAGIDPMDIDTATEPAYLEGNHRVTDAESNFRTVLDDLHKDPEGQKTIQTIHTTWDQASKEVLWDDPAIMTTIHEQRANGIYAAITTEMDRQKTLGVLPMGMPFLTAYKQIGDAMAAAAARNTTPPTGSSAGTAPVVATRTAAPKLPDANEDKVSAATLTRSTPGKAKAVVNPLAMSDDDFLKQMNGRL